MLLHSYVYVTCAVKMCPNGLFNFILCGKYKIHFEVEILMNFIIQQFEVKPFNEHIMLI